MSDVTTKDGLLWRDGKIIDLPEADHVARQYGEWIDGRLVSFVWAEQMVRALKDGKPVEKIIKLPA